MLSSQLLVISFDYLVTTQSRLKAKPAISLTDSNPHGLSHQCTGMLTLLLDLPPRARFPLGKLTLLLYLQFLAHRPNLSLSNVRYVDPRQQPLYTISCRSFLPQQLLNSLLQVYFFGCFCYELSGSVC